MFDTNIFLDVIFSRKEFEEDSRRALGLCGTRIEGLFPVSALTDVFYLVRKRGGIESAYAAVRDIAGIARLADVTAADAAEALAMHARDFEDCLVAACARAWRCVCICTRNHQDFANLGLPALSPAQLLALYQQW